ncbi:hypothetical protein [Trichococcus pasteurii]|uniref:Uncharacterized protein n=1 Tax=Trichococcus pasteurii TaxID=43064 RepID=A0A1W1IDA4_9LACT|nr:hypothetical protein [Trichococcus pasteurii]SFE37463.1 hypothetical protein SAMN04488086_10359 [Trichococcus pasteurii]SLM50849.1 Hypothetical protein TPAS_521 [Trichococcus pasteurii]SSB91730.1 Hypothetical protein TPAS_521 [Trichococcus pasteurii]
MSEENRLILAEKYYTRNQISISDLRMAQIKKMKLKDYQKILRAAQAEFCTHYNPLDKLLIEEYENKRRQEQERRIKAFEKWQQNWKNSSY